VQRTYRLIGFHRVLTSFPCYPASRASALFALPLRKDVARAPCTPGIPGSHLHEGVSHGIIRGEVDPQLRESHPSETRRICNSGISMGPRASPLRSPPEKSPMVAFLRRHRRIVKAQMLGRECRGVWRACQPTIGDGSDSVSSSLQKQGPYKLLILQGIGLPGNGAKFQTESLPDLLLPG
jgi:hypothetical protein